MATRYVVDCRTYEGSDCSLTIAGTKDEVIPVAVKHAVDAHGYKDTPELRDEIESMLVEEREPVTA